MSSSSQHTDPEDLEPHPKSLVKLALKEPAESLQTHKSFPCSLIGRERERHSFCLVEGAGVSHPGEALISVWTLSSLSCHRPWGDSSQFPPELSPLLDPCPRLFPHDRVDSTRARDPEPWLTTLKQDAPAGKTSLADNLLKHLRHLPIFHLPEDSTALALKKGKDL